MNSDLEAQKAYDTALKNVKATIGQYADYYPIPKSVVKEKKMPKTPKLDAVCQNCGDTWAHHFGVKCQSGGDWKAPKEKEKSPCAKLGAVLSECIAPKTTTDPQMLDNNIMIVEQALNGLMHTGTKISYLSAIAALRYATSMSLEDAKGIAKKWQETHGWFKLEPDAGINPYPYTYKPFFPIELKTPKFVKD